MEEGGIYGNKGLGGYGREIKYHNENMSTFQAEYIKGSSGTPGH